MRGQSLALWLPVLLIAGAESHGWNVVPGGYRQPQLYPQAQRSQQPGYFEVVQGTIDQLNDIDAQWVCTNQKSGDMMVIGTDNANTGNGRFPGNVNFQPRPQQPTYNPQRSPQPGYPQYPQQQVPQYNPQQQGPQFNPQQQGPPYNPQQPIPQNPQQPIPQNPQQPLPQNPQQPLPQNPQQQIPQNPQQQIPQNPQQVPQNPQNPQQQIPKNPGFPELPWTILPGTTTTDPLKKFDNFDWSSYVTTAVPTRGSGQDAQLGHEGEGIVEPRSGKQV